MKNWNLPLIVYLCVALGCTKATIDPPVKGRGELLRGGKENSPTEVVVARTGQDRCQAKVGQVVHFPFDSWVPPGPPTPLTSKSISSLKVEVNGVAIQDPEVFRPEVSPGSSYGELVYVLRPKTRGVYRVKVTPVYDRPKEGETWACVVDVSD
jgi:hypothetical protein